MDARMTVEAVEATRDGIGIPITFPVPEERVSENDFLLWQSAREQVIRAEGALVAGQQQLNGVLQRIWQGYHLSPTDLLHADGRIERRGSAPTEE